jgi:Domain of unknown function (DUF4919)
MTRFRLSLALAMAGILIAAGSITPASAQTKTNQGDEAVKERDRKFDAMLAAALKEPKKADWKAVRHAYSQTSHYSPYGNSWREDAGKVVKNMKEGKLKEAEAGLSKLMETEHSMRIDGHAMAAALYEQLGDSEKARKHKEIFEALSFTVFPRGEGMTIDKSFEVLFIEEEYTALGLMGLRVKQQALTDRNGHKFDVLTTHSKPGEPERVLYFNIDMPWKSLESGFTNVFEKSEKAPPKKK